MAATTTTALDIIVGALRNINALEAGETPASQDSNDALQVLNDLLESWSIDHLFIYAQTENIVNLTSGQYQYTIGNANGGTFTGTLASGSAVISSVTVPAGLVVNGFLTEIQGLIPANTQVLSIGANTVTMTANALGTSVGADTFTYTLPGNFYKDNVTGGPINRPVRITNAFTRITASGSTGLDYFIDIIPRDKYTALGFKGIAGPWPKVVYYDPTYPLGNLYFYPNPTGSGVLHLWTDTVLSDFATLTQNILLPQGYARALKKNLALELAPEYGKSAGSLLVKQAMESKAMIKSINAIPAVQAFFDADIVKGNRTDAGWIFSGGFTP